MRKNLQAVADVEVNHKNHEITGEEMPSEDEIQIRAELQARKEKRENEKACLEGVEKVLADHNCGMATSFKLGEQLIPTQQLVNLPVMVTITSR